MTLCKYVDQGFGESWRHPACWLPARLSSPHSKPTPCQHSWIACGVNSTPRRQEPNGSRPTAPYAPPSGSPAPRWSAEVGRLLLGEPVLQPRQDYLLRPRGILLQQSAVVDQLIILESILQETFRSAPSGCLRRGHDVAAGPAEMNSPAKQHKRWQLECPGCGRTRKTRDSPSLQGRAVGGQDSHRRGA